MNQIRKVETEEKEQAARDAKSATNNNETHKITSITISEKYYFENIVKIRNMRSFNCVCNE